MKNFTEFVLAAVSKDDGLKKNLVHFRQHPQVKNAKIFSL